METELSALVDREIQGDRMSRILEVAVLEGVLHDRDQHKGQDAQALRIALDGKDHLQGIAKAELLDLYDIMDVLDLAGEQHFPIDILFLVQGITHDLREREDAF